MANTTARSRLRIAGSTTLSPVAAVFAIATLIASCALILMALFTT